MKLMCCSFTSELNSLVLPSVKLIMHFLLTAKCVTTRSVDSVSGGYTEPHGMKIKRGGTVSIDFGGKHGES